MSNETDLLLGLSNIVLQHNHKLFIMSQVVEKAHVADPSSLMKHQPSIIHSYTLFSGNQQLLQCPPSLQQNMLQEDSYWKSFLGKTDNRSSISIDIWMHFLVEVNHF